MASRSRGSRSSPDWCGSTPCWRPPGRPLSRARTRTGWSCSCTGDLQRRRLRMSRASGSNAGRAGAEVSSGHNSQGGWSAAKVKDQLEQHTRGPQQSRDGLQSTRPWLLQRSQQRALPLRTSQARTCDRHRHRPLHQGICLCSTTAQRRTSVGYMGAVLVFIARAISERSPRRPATHGAAG